MYPIKDVVDLNDEVVRMVVEAPAISKKVKPGQFIMLRIDEQGERIPLTVNDANPEQGTITLVFQKVGATTRQMGMMTAGQSIRDVAGPL
ncbi:MAG: sulfide/dihydroorotate dehydrogenase-like FAD/NAD-binding protein, partial [Eggerthellaceae bacterium]|nr:sulfide/dihydroorotate dehydrogenase-like FAD/NAD-binding protein [Eggerthellaceae bacterium]